MRSQGHRACRKERKVRTGYWWGNLKVNSYLEDLGVDGSTIYKKVLGKLILKRELDSSGSRQTYVA